ncbi:MAG: putative membrane protein [Oceanospirillaceae bacterium]|jgi:uncharacterized membrane protein
MNTKIVIRGKWDRLRFTLIFEMLLIALIAPILAWTLERGALDTGFVSLVLGIKAMILNFIYNYVFDLVDVNSGRIPTQRSVKRRIGHALGFELLLTLTSLPIIIWWLDLNLWQALIIDISVMGVVVLYTLVFTRIYDGFFPIQQHNSIQSIAIT